MKSKKIKPQFIKKVNPRVGLIVLATDVMIEKDFLKVFSGISADLYVNRITNFNPVTADNLKKSGAFIPGIRPGDQTAKYIDDITTRLTTVGALYLTFVCLMPEFLIAKYPIPFYLGGTSILIVVVVAIDTVTQIQTRLMSSQYEQLIKKTKFGK